jgi:hypothetical protein
MRVIVRRAVAAAFGVAVGFVIVGFVAVCCVLVASVLVMVMPGVIVPFVIVIMRARGFNATRSAAAPARRPFLITRPQALRSGKPRQEALIHRPTLPNVTQSLNSL